MTQPALTPGPAQPGNPGPGNLGPGNLGSGNPGPGNPWLAHTVVVEDICPETPGVATYRLRFREPAVRDGYRFLPGQFNMLYLPGCGESAISLSGDPSRPGELIHTIRVVGRVTEAIAALEVGETLGLRGPYGTPWPMEACRDQDVVLVAGGIGLAPLRPVLLALSAATPPTRRRVLLYGGRSPDTLLYSAEFDTWRRRGWDVRVTVDRAPDDWPGTVGVVTGLLDRLSPLDSERTVVLTCGPEVMMDFTVRAALRRGVPRERIWLSMERNMQCAVGLCGHCQLGPAFVCRQGPVFRLDAIEPYLRVRDL